MKKRYLPPSPLKVAHKNAELTKKKDNENCKPTDKHAQDRKRRRKLIIGTMIVLLLVAVGLAVYVVKFSNFCWVWQEYWYQGLKNEAECIHIRDNIRKSRVLSTAGFRFVS